MSLNWRLNHEECSVCVTDLRPDLLALCVLTSHIHSLLSGGFCFVVFFWFKSRERRRKEHDREEKQDVVVPRSGFLQHGWSPVM